MKESNKNRLWRVNVLVTYDPGISPINYRKPIVGILYNLAWLYKLDFSEKREFQFLGDENSVDEANRCIYDLFYYRSTDRTRVTSKYIRTVIESVFSANNPLLDGFDVYTLYQKLLPDFPFPEDFERPLMYPYVEIHKGRQKKIYIYSDEIMKVIEAEQDCSLN